MSYRSFDDLDLANDEADQAQHRSHISEGQRNFLIAAGVDPDTYGRPVIVRSRNGWGDLSETVRNVLIASRGYPWCDAFMDCLLEGGAYSLNPASSSWPVKRARWIDTL